MKDCNIKLDLLKRLRYNNEKFCKLGISKNCLEIAPDNKQNFFGSACYPCLKLKQQKKLIMLNPQTYNMHHKSGPQPDRQH